MQYLRSLIYLAVCKISADMKAVEIYGEENKIVFAASLPGMPLETSHFVRDRCRYVGRDAAL